MILKKALIKRKELVGEKHYGYTRELRINIFMASPVAKHFSHLLEDKERFGAGPEARESFFGPTFIQNITLHLKDTAEVRKALEGNRSVHNSDEGCPIFEKSPSITELSFFKFNN